MLHRPNQPSEARRLTDVLREASERGERFGDGRGHLEERAATLQMVLEGGVLRERFLADGRCQTVAIYYRDDVINLRAYIGTPDGEADYMRALPGTVVGYVPDATVEELRSSAPEGHDGVSVLIHRELGIAQQRIHCLGQRSAIEHMAHFFCETVIRCGKGSKRNACSLMMTQEMLSSVLGLSTVHVNRVLAELRRKCLAKLSHRELLIPDFEALARLAEFDEGYLTPDLVPSGRRPMPQQRMAAWRFATQCVVVRSSLKAVAGPLRNCGAGARGRQE